MNFRECYDTCDTILTEGAIGIRLRNEYGITPDPVVANASLLYDEQARDAIKEITGQYIHIAREYQLPMMLMTSTRKANRYNVERSAYTKEIIRDNADFIRRICEKANPMDALHTELFAGGMMGCKGDAYTGAEALGAEEAYEFHSWQAQLFREAKVDYLYACIMPMLPETIGMAKALADTGIPYIISFMVRKDGRLIDGTTIHDAIAAVEAAVSEKPIFYMTNCVHPVNVGLALTQEFNQTELVRTRFQGIQANASPLSPEELDGCCGIVSSEPWELAEEMMKLRKKYGFKVLGGCCGTDQRHIEELARRLTSMG